MQSIWIYAILLYCQGGQKGAGGRPVGLYLAPDLTAISIDSCHRLPVCGAQAGHYLWQMTSHGFSFAFAASFVPARIPLWLQWQFFFCVCMLE